VHLISTRYDSLNDGKFHRRTGFDRDLREGELAVAIARARTGDEEALRYLYLRFSANVFGYARSILRDEYEAEDVTQQVFARLMTSIASYQDRGAPFSAWLLRVTHNLAIDHMRRRLNLCDETSVTEESDESRGPQLAQILREALDELPEPQRQVVVLRQVAGWSPGEIAQALERSEDAVHGLHHRGRRALREQLVAMGAAPVVAAAA
jgi:RNA polymerase sigma-70 factor (ECF subfamily)